MGLHGLLLRSMRGFIGVSFSFLYLGKTWLAERFNAQAGALKISAPSSACLKMISGYILTVLILDFFLSLLLWNDVDCVTGAL